MCSPALGQTPTSSSPLCLSQLEPAIAAIMNRPHLSRSRWGIFIQTLPNNGAASTLYSHESTRFFIPASTIKLLTSAAALTRLGGEFRIRTSVYREPSPRNQLWLRLVGRGDPTMTDRQLDQFAREVGNKLRNQGIDQIDRFVIDDQYFQGDSVHPTWEWEDTQLDTGAPVTSLILNQNALGITLTPTQLGQPLRLSWNDQGTAPQWQINNQSITVSPSQPESIHLHRNNQGVLSIRGQLHGGSEPYRVGIAVVNATKTFVTRLHQQLVSQRLNVKQIVTATTPLSSTAMELASIDSAPLSTILEEVNHYSNNLYAEVLLRIMGVQYALQTRQINSDSASLGLAAVRQTLTQMGVDPESYEQSDGSGLSRRNLVSPEAIVQTLQAAYRTTTGDLFRSTLPVAGVTGTLRNRFRHTDAAGIMVAKTGFLEGVAALAGYITPAHYPPLAFSIIINQSNQPPLTLRQAIDDMVILLTRLQLCK
ncbi:MAG: D-alanyl-D-alanine carboxypeptidase/D-alanyl-D-alanine-endopeptidase [Synechococcales cyanobacterium]